MDGGSPIFDYRVTYSYKSSPVSAVVTQNTMVGGITPSYTLKDLLSGKRYTITVAARNSVGYSNESESIVVQTLANLPSEPLNLRLGPNGVGQNTAQLVWDTPLFDGGSDGPITDYRVTVRYPDSEKVVSTFFTGPGTVMITLTSLIAGQTHIVTVAAYNTPGKGPESTKFTFKTQDPSFPGTPTGLSVVSVSHYYLNLTWQAPTDTGGVPLSTFRLTITHMSTTQTTTVYLPASARAYNMEDLPPSTAYTISIAVNNSIGWSLESPSVNPTTLAVSPPSVPLNVRILLTTNSTIAVNWMPPSTDNGSPLIGYRISYRISPSSGSGNNGDTTVYQDNTYDAANTTYVLTGLTPATTYQVSVAATNVLGTGPDSAYVIGRTLATPRTPGGGGSTGGDDDDDTSTNRGNIGEGDATSLPNGAASLSLLSNHYGYNSSLAFAWVVYGFISLLAVLSSSLFLHM